MSRPTIFVVILCSILAISATGLEPPITSLQEAEDAFTKGNYPVAAEKYRKALSILKQNGDSKAVADTSYKLGTSLNKISSYPEAIQVLSEALKFHEQTANREAAGFDLIEITYAQMRQGNYEEALDSARKALAIHESTGNQKGIADTFRNMAYIYQFRSEHEKSFEYCERSLEISTKIGDKQGMAISLSRIGSLHWRLSNFEQALEYYKKALPIAVEIGDRLIQFQVQGNMALVYWNQGDLQTALDYNEKVRQITEEMGNRQGLAINLFNTGLIEMELGDYKKANESLHSALSKAEEIGDKGLTSACLDGLGVMEQELGNYDAALEYVNKAAKIAEEIGEKRPLAYEWKNIGSIYSMRGNYTDSLTFYQKALRLYREMEEKRGIGITLNQIGAVQAHLGNLDQAMDSYEEALALSNSIGSKPLLAESYLNIGSIYSRKGKFIEAEEALSKAAEYAKEVGYPNLLWQCFHQEGLLLSKTGRSAEAIDSMKKAVEIIEKVRSQVQLADQKAGYLEDKLEAYEDTIRVLVKTENIPEAFEYAQRSKARSFLDMLAEARIDPASNLRPEQLDKKRKLIKQLTNLNNDIQQENENETPDKAKLEKLSRQQTKLEEEYSNLIVEIRKSNPRYAAVQYPQPLKVAEAQTLLDENSALLEYFVGKSGSFLFVITPESSNVFSLPPETKLTNLVQQVREVLQKPEPVWEASEKSHSKWISGARALYDLLLQPTESLLHGKKRLVIAPDGALNYLPFECLLKRGTKSTVIDFAKLPYVARDYEIHYVPSMSVLAAVENQPDESGNEQKEFLALADPSYGSGTTSVRGILKASGTVLPALPNARLEVGRIAALYPKGEVTVLTGKDASEKNVKRMNLSQYKRVHFASHGLIDQDRPQFSALLLASEATGEEDGYLTMREVFDLHLHADFVVLSACRTGLGHQIRGEGISGLFRAFFCAGTSSVLVSLWNVYDQSTAEFMTSFYRNLAKAGMNKAAALKEARIQMIRNGKYSHPYYWAPFVLIGNQ